LLYLSHQFVFLHGSLGIGDLVNVAHDALFVNQKGATSTSDLSWLFGVASGVARLLPIVKGDVNDAAPFRQEGPRNAVY
jgi:hypothetical protein